MEINWIQPIDDFLGARLLTNPLRSHLKQFESERHQPLYRGMSFPKPLLKEGEILEEWHGSSHWSKDMAVSFGFAYDGYINEDYYDEMMDEYGFENPDDFFVPVIFRLQTSSKGIDIHTMIQEVEPLSNWHKEQEVCFIGHDFVMKEILYVTDDKKPYYLVDVIEKK